jgi:hypothetical protein
VLLYRGEYVLLRDLRFPQRLAAQPPCRTQCRYGHLAADYPPPPLSIPHRSPHACPNTIRQCCVVIVPLLRSPPVAVVRRGGGELSWCVPTTAWLARALILLCDSREASGPTAPPLRHPSPSAPLPCPMFPHCVWWCARVCGEGGCARVPPCMLRSPCGTRAARTFLDSPPTPPPPPTHPHLNPTPRTPLLATHPPSHKIAHAQLCFMLAPRFMSAFTPLTRGGLVAVGRALTTPCCWPDTPPHPTPPLSCVPVLQAGMTGSLWTTRSLTRWYVRLSCNAQPADPHPLELPPNTHRLAWPASVCTGGGGGTRAAANRVVRRCACNSVRWRFVCEDVGARAC